MNKWSNAFLRESSGGYGIGDCLASGYFLAGGHVTSIECIGLLGSNLPLMFFGCTVFVY